MKVSSVDQMRAMDRAACQEYGIAELLLMENAGHAAYSTIQKEFGIKGKTFCILCGTGNNGGDGFVVARKIFSMHGRVLVFLLGNRARLKGAAKLNLEIATRLGLPVIEAGAAKQVEESLTSCHAVVDALFGTGLTRDVTGIYREIIEMINASGKWVCSLDIPSGINADTGRTMGVAVNSNCTATFGLPKPGKLLYPGYARCGKLYVSHISFPPAIYAKCQIEISDPPELPRRNVEGHKGDFGDVLFIAGAAGYFGAPGLSALSFLKAGGGYSRLAAPSSIIPSIAVNSSEVVFHPQFQTENGGIAQQNQAELLELAERVDMVVIGPGLSLDGETQDLVRAAATAIRKPLLIDGDGLTALSADTDIISRREHPTVLTPHLGEMARLTGSSAEDVDADKVAVLQSTAQKLNATIVLKGAHTLIGHPDRRVYINLNGNCGMATAGAGDVLTGTIAAMFGLGQSLETAVTAGVFIHGLAGDLASKKKGQDGITAHDIMDYLPAATRRCRNNFAKVKKQYWRRIKVL